MILCTFEAKGSHRHSEFYFATSSADLGRLGPPPSLTDIFFLFHVTFMENLAEWYFVLSPHGEPWNSNCLDTYCIRIRRSWCRRCTCLGIQVLWALPWRTPASQRLFERTHSGQNILKHKLQKQKRKK